MWDLHNMDWTKFGESKLRYMQVAEKSRSILNIMKVFPMIDMCFVPTFAMSRLVHEIYSER